MLWKSSKKYVVKLNNLSSGCQPVTCTSISWWLSRYAFCMVFHVRWIFLTTSLRIPPESRSDEGGIRRRVVRKIHLTWKTIQNAFSRILYTLRHFKYTVQSCRSWKPCEMDLSHNCSLHGGMSEVCEKLLNHKFNIWWLQL